MLDAAPMPTTEGGVPLTLFALVRTARLDEAIVQGRPTGLVDLVDAGGAPSLVAGTDAARRKALLGAYASLDDRDRVLLWFSAVEGTMPKALSGRLAIGGADMASTKTFRARSNLRRAYAERRSAGPGWPVECKARAADLARRADGERADMATHADDHLASCPRCTALLAELHALTSGLLDEAARVLQGVDARRVRAGRAGVASTAAVAATAAAVEPVAALVGTPEHFEPDTDEPARARAFAVAGVGLLVAAAIVAFAVWGAGRNGDRPVHVATPGTSHVRRLVVSSPAPTASVKSATTSTSTTRRHGTTTTSTTTRSTGTRHSETGGSGGGWTPPPSGGTTPTTPPTLVTTTPPTKPTATTTTTAATTTTTLVEPPTTKSETP